MRNSGSHRLFTAPFRMGHANFGLNDHRARRTQLYTLVTRGSIVILENSRKSDYDFFLELYLSFKVFILIISQHSHLEFDLELDLWLFFSRTLDDSKIQYFLSIRGIVFRNLD